MKTLIIIPAFNEQASIAATVRNVQNAAIDNFEIAVINDGSADGTAAAAASQGVRVLNLPSNTGIGGAVQTGYRFGAQEGFDAVVQFDGDGQHEAAFLPTLLACLGDSSADLVIGSRFCSGAADGFKSTALRRIGIRYLSALIRTCTGKMISDPTSGFRAAGPRAVSLFARMYPHDYPEPVSLVVAHRHGLTWTEIPVQMHERSGGVSSIKALDSIRYMIIVTLSIGIELIRRTNERTG